MKGISRILASTLAAATMLGSASAAANACGPGDGTTRPFAHHHHHHLTFAQRQALIVARLTRADHELSGYISRLAPAAQTDPTSWQAQAVTHLQQKQARLEALIAAVKAATTDQQIADAFRTAFHSDSVTYRWSRG